jgi:hypothetical protein
LDRALRRRGRIRQTRGRRRPSAVESCRLETATTGWTGDSCSGTVLEGIEAGADLGRVTMSVTIATNPQPASFWQRLTGTEPKTVIRETSTTEVTSVEGGSFNIKDALRNGGIGAAVAGALGGVSLLGKVALPFIGKIASVGGLVKLAGIGGALGVATAALPLVTPHIRNSPAAKAAVTGAAIGAAAGAILPLMPITLGAAIGAGVGLLVHNRRNRPVHEHTMYPGYRAYPGYVPVGTSPGDSSYPHGLVPVTPNYGMYSGTAMNPYAMGSYGYPAPNAGYGQMPVSPYASTMSPQYGYGQGYGMSLPMQATGQQAARPAAQAAPSRGAAAPAPVKRPASKPKHPGAKTYKDPIGNVRQVGTGKIIRAVAPRATQPAVGTVPAGTAAPVGLASPYGTAVQPQAQTQAQAQAQAQAAMLASMGNPASYLTGSAGAAPLGSTAAGVQPTAMPARPVA